MRKIQCDIWSLGVVHPASRKSWRRKRAGASLTFDDSGTIKVTKKQELSDCNLSGDLRLRSAMQRRALAYHLAGVATFIAQEKWTNLLFARMQQEPPPGFKYVSQDQVVRADKALWLKVAEETRARVQATGATKTVDQAIEKWSIHLEIQYSMMRLPTVKGPADITDIKKLGPGIKKDDSNKDCKGKGKGKGKIVVPEDCTIKFGETNKPICMKYNVGVCRANIKAGKTLYVRIPCLLET